MPGCSALAGTLRQGPQKVHLESFSDIALLTVFLPTWLQRAGAPRKGPKKTQSYHFGDIASTTLGHHLSPSPGCGAMASAA